VLVHDRFVFLQMRKTGSTFLVDALRRELPEGSCRALSKHSDWGKMPPAAARLPVLVYVRNPWDWYVSWYHFNQMQGGTPNGFWRTLSGNGQVGFTTTVRRACVGAAAIMGGDLYSTLFRNLVGDGLDSERLTVARFESLFDDLEGFLASAGVALADGAIERIRAGSPVNASGHGPYREYYDDKSRDVVEEWCRPLIDRFDYRF
jgi:hypothetical protein